MMITGAFIGVALYLAWLLGRCSFRVDEGHIAVLTSFGAALEEGGRLKTYGPGLHFRRPWWRTTIISMMEQNLDLSGKEGGRTAMADDGTILRFDSILRYLPIESQLYTFLFSMKKPLEHITWLFTCLLRNEIANFRIPEPDSAAEAEALAPVSNLDFTMQGGSYALIRRERKRLNEVLEHGASTQIGERYGVKFNAVDLVDVLPPDELADALNAVMHAQTDAETRYFRAEGDCRQRVLAAERGVEIARSRARAVATEIEKLGEHLATLSAQGTLEHYVERRRGEILAESRTLYLKETR